MKIGRIEVFAGRTHPWAYLAVVKEGPSLEVVVGTLSLVISGGVAGGDDPVHVWSLKRERKDQGDAANNQGGPPDGGATQARP